jgi:hypothetical protein
MGDLPAILHETVTSDTTQPTPPGGRFQMTGPELVDNLSYRSQVVSSVIDLGGDADTVDIAFALPAEGIYVRLVTGPDGRPDRETITSPNHLIQHAFSYP